MCFMLKSSGENSKVMPLSKQKLLVLSFTDHYTDPRVFRQIEALHKDFYVITAGTSTGTHQKTEHVQLTKERHTFVEKVTMAIKLKARFYETTYWGQQVVKMALKKLDTVEVDAIVANDLETLPLALKLARDKKIKLYFDAHEYSPKEFDGNFMFDYFLADYHHYLCKTYLPSVDVMTTVCQGIADEYKKVYGVNCSVLTNTPEYADLTPQEANSKHIKIIHHGGINASRKIENMIQLVGEKLDKRFQMDLMLVNNDSALMSSLQAWVDKYPNVRIVDPVPMRDIAQVINKYDIGLYLLPSESFNNNLVLPNKIFEFIQGRLAVAIWPSIEMKRIVDECQLGLVADDSTIDAMAEILNNLTVEDLNRFKQNSHKAAAIYNAENNAEQLKLILSRLCQ